MENRKESTKSLYLSLQCINHESLLLLSGWFFSYTTVIKIWGFCESHEIILANKLQLNFIIKPPTTPKARPITTKKSLRQILSYLLNAFTTVARQSCLMNLHQIHLDPDRNTLWPRDPDNFVKLSQKEMNERKKNRLVDALLFSHGIHGGKKIDRH